MKGEKNSVSEETTEALFDRYVVPNYGRFPVSMARGEGSWIWDEHGRKYLDYGGGIAVCALGHAPPCLSAVLDAQSRKLIHCSNLYYNRQQALLAQHITEKIIGAPGKIFFCNSGAEANDALIKLARRFGHAVPQAGGAQRHEIITFENSFHGRTLGGIAATAQPKVKEGFAPLLPGFVHVPYNDLHGAREAIGAKTVAIMLEAVQGEGGVHTATPEFLLGIADLCREHQLLLMVDEVQCGLGRTGDLCAWHTVLGKEENGFAPDAVSWAKGLGGGVPIGAIWVRDRAQAEHEPEPRLCNLLGPGSHGSTFGGTPLVSAAALAVLEEIEASRWWEHARDLGQWIRDEIRSWQSGLIQEVRGLGLMLGVCLDAENMASRVPAVRGGKVTPSLHIVRALMGEGLLTVPAGDTVVRLLPPLNTSREEAAEALKIFRGVLAELEGA